MLSSLSISCSLSFWCQRTEVLTELDRSKRVFMQETTNCARHMAWVSTLIFTKVCTLLTKQLSSSPLSLSSRTHHHHYLTIIITIIHDPHQHLIIITIIVTIIITSSSPSPSSSSSSPSPSSSSSSITVIITITIIITIIIIIIHNRHHHVTIIVVIIIVVIVIVDVIVILDIIIIIIITIDIIIITIYCLREMALDSKNRWTSRSNYIFLIPVFFRKHRKNKKTFIGCYTVSCLLLSVAPEKVLCSNLHPNFTWTPLSTPSMDSDITSIPLPALKNFQVRGPARV